MTVLPFPRPGKAGPETTGISTCRVHGEPLIAGEVPVVYGLLRTTSIYDDAERRLYPWASTFSSGGCVVGFGQRQKATTHYCQACRRTRRAWLRLNWREQAPGREPGFGLTGPVGWIRDWLELVRTRRTVRALPSEGEDDPDHRY